MLIAMKTCGKSILLPPVGEDERYVVVVDVLLLAKVLSDFNLGDVMRYRCFCFGSLTAV